MKISELLNEAKYDDTPHSIESVYGINVQKYTMKTHFGKKMANFHYLTDEQHSAWSKLEKEGFSLENAWYVMGKENPRDVKSDFFTKDIPVFVVKGEKGATAVLPSGKLKKVSSKTWKPEVKDFRE